MTVLNSRQLDAGYDGRPVVRGVALSVCSGKIAALIGPNGAGKSTLLKTFAGLLQPVAGTVFIDSVDAFSIKPGERAKLLAAMTTNRAAADYATCFDVVGVGRYQYTGAFGRLTPSDVRAVDDALKAVDAYELRDKEFAKLSDGQKQRVLLARALAQEPRVMILDEPTSFLDVGYKLTFADTLRRLAREKNVGALVSIHELELARAVADLVVCLSADNRIDRVGTPGEIFQTDYIERLFNIPNGGLKHVYGFLTETPDDNAIRGEIEDFAIREDAQTVNNAFAAPGSELLPELRAETTNGSADELPRLGASASPASGQSSKRSTRFLMIQGSMSGVGKSLLTAGLCRIFYQDGRRVAPFKSQNMALNSFVTQDGLEMGRAQVMQAEAAGAVPDVAMNPILLKPTDDCGSQVIVNGKVVGNMRAREYFQYKKTLVPTILRAIDKLSAEADVIVIEGAGSPAEINLRANDIVNMGMAELVDSPVLLVADIDRGGVFAQLLGTIELLEPSERARVKGLIINKFRGDKSLLDSGIREIERRAGIPVVGVVPYMELELEDEDSLTERLAKPYVSDRRKNAPKIVVGAVRFPHIANFTDFNTFEQIDELELRYVKKPEELDALDMLILPGSKNTIEDRRWLTENGFDPVVKAFANKDKPIVGICGGYQMLGVSIDDPESVEAGGSVQGLGLLPVRTTLTSQKRRAQVRARICAPGGVFAELKNAEYYGYEIHMGKTVPVGGELGSESVSPLLRPFTPDGSGWALGSVYGTYAHGLFDSKDVLTRVVRKLAELKGVSVALDRVEDYDDLKEREYDRLADALRKNVDVDAIYKILRGEI